MSWLSPLAKSYATSGWGDPRPKRKGTHYGIDLRAPVGTPIFAVAAGRVVAVDLARKTAAGILLILDLGNGARVGYAHLSQIIVRLGTTVSAGELLGYTGITAQGTTNVTSGAHLHLTVRMRGQALANYIAQFGAPKRWLSTTNFGQAVPAEPLWPMTYSQRVVDRAHQRGVKLYAPGQTAPASPGQTAPGQTAPGQTAPASPGQTALPSSPAVGAILCLIFVLALT